MTIVMLRHWILLFFMIFSHKFQIILGTTNKIGVISNVSLQISNNNSNIIINGACNKCICAMLLNSTSISALNCFPLNKTCQLFSNDCLSKSFSFKDDLTSSFYFFPSLISGIISTTENVIQGMINFEGISGLIFLGFIL